MKGSLTLIQRRRFGFRLATIIAVLSAAAFVTATALMQGGSDPQESAGDASSAPVQSADVKLAESLFVDEDEDKPRQAAQEAPAADQGAETPAYSIPKVKPAVFSGDVRNLAFVPQNMREFREPGEPSNDRPFMPEALKEHPVQPNIPLAPMPNPIQNFAGLTRTDLCTGGQCGAGIPPDTNGDVGPNHYIQTVNTAVGIYNKTGTLLASFTLNSLWNGAGTGTPCDANHGGDPVVVYDSMADRWIISDLGFAFNGLGQPIAPYYECIAASKTSDPVAGGWYLYPIRTDTGATGQPPAGTLNDYPKFGVWTDCLYYSANGFINAAVFNGVEFGSFSRADMYSGAALTGAIGFIAGNTNFALLPANLSAPAAGLPPPGTLEYFVAESATAFSWDVRKFTPGTHCGGGGVMGAAVNVTQPIYTVPNTNIVPQPNDVGSTHNLDSLGDRLMQKAQYRNVAGTESIWVVHTTRSAPASNTQPGWAQLNVTAGTVAAAPVQQQNYAPDLTLFRWMGNIAADKDGNVAIGYSTSNATSPNFPSIAYSGRLAGDTLNQLPQSEVQLVAGAGSELNTCGGAACHRWGDYSSMSVDPSDSCTFWLTSEYYINQASGNTGAWNTRIGSFVFPTCTAAVSSPTVPNAPTGLSFTSVAATSMTLNWTDNASNEDSYVIYRSTDNVNFTFAAQLGANAVSGNVGGLNPSTLYFFKVYATTNGALSTALTGSQSTTAPIAATSTAAGGPWSQTATWSSGIVPTNADNVTITDGATVTVDTAAVALNLTVGSGGAPAILIWDATTPQSLTVGQSVTIASNGTFIGPATGIVTAHVLSVGGDLTNNGVLDFSTNANTAGAGITFTGAANNTFGGTGATTDIRSLTINKGISFVSTLELNPTNFTVQGVTTDVAGFLTQTNGTFKVSGNFTITNRVFTVTGYTIPATAGFWLNNPNFTVAGQNNSPTNNGLLRVSQGTFNVGTASGNAMGGGSASVFTIEGGTLNFTGRLNSTNAVTYTQSGGTVNVSTIGNALSNTAEFGFTSAGSVLNMTGGQINLVQRSTGATILDYRVDGSVIGGGGTTLQAGTAATATNFDFRIRGNAPALVIDNTTNNKQVLLSAATTVLGTLTVNTGATLNSNGFTFLMSGPSATNNGAIIGTVANSRFDFQRTGAQTYSGSGTFGTNALPFAGVGVSISNLSGVTLNAPIVTNRVNLFFGTFTNSSQFTLGNGGVSATVVQVGQAAGTQVGGSFDVSPVHNQGSGGETLLYLQEAAPRTTGFEVNPTRVLASMTVDNTNNLIISGGDLTLSSAAVAATLTNGRVITGSNTLYLSAGAATVTRTNGHVDGNLRKNFAASGSFVFPVGTANGFSPVTVNATAGTFPADFTAKATQGPQPNVNAATSVQRYWTLTNTTLSSADLTFAYLLADVQGTEANYKVIRISGGTPVAFPASTVNTVAHTATLLGATAFSDWTVGEISSPTASNSSIAGRITDINGAPVAGTTINLNGEQSAETITDSSGNYSFASVPTGGFYTVTPALANYTFSPANRSFSLVANKTDAIFTALPNAVPSMNAIDTNEYFVRQQYLDFLGREPDPGGFEYWTGRLNQCNGDVGCLLQQRIDVSAAFFGSREFRDTGAYVYRLYDGALGRQVSYSEFASDRQQVVGGANLDSAKAAFASEFVGRGEFVQKYQANTTAESFVDALLQTVRDTTNVDLSSERANLISRYNSGGTMNESRALVMRDAVENAVFSTAVYNPSFVLMEYFGYLKRGAEPHGYAFWLNVLNNSDAGNYRGMVCSFLTSTEYQLRFGTVVTHSNAACSGQ